MTNGTEQRRPQVGDIWRTREGNIAGPLQARTGSDYAFSGPVAEPDGTIDSEYETWTAEGRYNIVEGETCYDLVTLLAAPRDALSRAPMAGDVWIMRSGARAGPIRFLTKEEMIANGSEVYTITADTAAGAGGQLWTPDGMYWGNSDSESHYDFMAPVGEQAAVEPTPQRDRRTLSSQIAVGQTWRCVDGSIAVIQQTDRARRRYTISAYCHTRSGGEFLRSYNAQGQYYVHGVHDGYDLEELIADVGMDIIPRVGDVWKRRDGQLQPIEEVVDGAQFPIRAGSHSWRGNGRFSAVPTREDDMDLIQLVHREASTAPRVNTEHEGASCPVEAQTQPTPRVGDVWRMANGEVTPPLEENQARITLSQGYTLRAFVHHPNGGTIERTWLPDGRYHLDGANPERNLAEWLYNIDDPARPEATQAPSAGRSIDLDERQVQVTIPPMTGTGTKSTTMAPTIEDVTIQEILQRVAGDRNLEAVPTIPPQGGKYYLTRDCRIHGPAKPNHHGDGTRNEDYPWEVGGLTYTEHGGYLTNAEGEGADLIAEIDLVVINGRPAAALHMEQTDKTALLPSGKKIRYGVLSTMRTEMLQELADLSAEIEEAQKRLDALHNELPSEIKTSGRTIQL